MDASGKVLKLSQACPWKSHLFDLEEEAGTTGQYLYALYPDSAGGWRIQAVPVSPDSFESRKALPEPWRGVRDSELAAACGIADAGFAHASGFIGGAKSFEGAVEMARKAIAFEA